MADATVTCPQCGADNPAGAKVCKANPRCGSFLPRNDASRTTGIYARYQPPDLTQHRDALVAAVTSDLGGPSELSTLERSYVSKLADIEVITRLLTHDIAVNGLLTPGGRVRDVYEKLLAGLAAFDRYSMRLGLARRTRAVNPLDVVRAAVEEANRP